jgi:BirA family biotin operon repressor/biotin-[acetyl-CoA-carboxylase] ligase
MLMRSGGHWNWGAQALWAQLEPLLPGIAVEVVARTDSTNTQLIERARLYGGRRDAPVSRPGDLDAGTGTVVTPLGRRAGDAQPCLLVAEQQTRGRGRLGRDWASSPGASLTFSLALPLAPADWSGLSLAVGAALADALDPLPQGDAASSEAARIGVKWPNDLWLRDARCVGRKLGGVLIETVPVGRLRLCVVGVGLNVAPLQVVEGSGLSSGYACLQEIDPQATPPAVLARVALPLTQALLRFEREGFGAFAAAFARRDLLRGRAVLTAQPGVPEGVADGVDERGALRVRHALGQQSVVSGEVSVRLPERPSPGGAGQAPC